MSEEEKAVEKWLGKIVADNQIGLELSDFNPMPSTAMESAQKYIEMQKDGSDHWTWESNDYELCPVCQESINPDRPHECKTGDV